MRADNRLTKEAICLECDANKRRALDAERRLDQLRSNQVTKAKPASRPPISPEKRAELQAEQIQLIERLPYLRLADELGKAFRPLEIRPPRPFWEHLSRVAAEEGLEVIFSGAASNYVSNTYGPNPVTPRRRKQKKWSPSLSATVFLSALFTLDDERRARAEQIFVRTLGKAGLAVAPKPSSATPTRSRARSR